MTRPLSRLLNWSLGDFNGDGVVDALAYVPGVSGGDVFVGGPQGFLYSGSWTSAWNGGSDWVVGDFNGDGRDDILRHIAGVSNADVLLSTGNEFISAGSWLPANASLGSWQVGDFNGDGRDDLIAIDSQQWQTHVFLSAEDGRFQEASPWTQSGFGSQGWHLGDFNGDGRADLLRVMPGFAGAEVLLSTGSAFEVGKIWSIIAPMGSWTVVDIDGDGKDDLLDAAGNALVSTGTSFSSGPHLQLNEHEETLGITTVNGDLARLFLDDTGAPQLIGLEPDDSEERHLLDDVGTGFAPRLGYVGASLSFDPGELPNGYEARVVISSPEGGQISDWSSGPIVIVPETAGTFGWTTQVRAIGGEDIVAERYGGRAFNVMSIEAAADVAVLDRLRLSEVRNDVSSFAARQDWRGEIHSFTDLSQLIAEQFAERAVVNLSADGSELRERAFHLTSFVASLWGYGSATREDGAGQITDNEVTGQTPASEVDVDLFMRSTIADCEDFAGTLAVLLTLAGFENRVVMNPSHVFNEALIDGQWWTLDATFGLAINHPFDFALDQSTTPNVFIFDQIGRTEGSDFYRPSLIAALHEHLNLVDNGVFPNASRYGTVDYLKLYDYSHVFTDELDLTGWIPGTPTLLPNAPTGLGEDLQALLALGSLDRLHMSEVVDDVAAHAGEADWRTALHTGAELLDFVRDLARTEAPTGTDVDRALFHLQFVSGLWRLEDSSGTIEASIEEMLARPEASSQDRASLLSWLLAADDIHGRVIVSGERVLVEADIGDGTWILDPTSGLAFESDWAGMRSTDRDIDVLVFAIPGREEASAGYDTDLAGLKHATLTTVANGSLGQGETVAFADWLPVHGYGAVLSEALARSPELLDVRHTTPEPYVPRGTESLTFVVDFNKRVAGLDDQAFTVTGTDATVTGIVDEGFGRYLVTVSGGNLGLIKGEVAITLDPAGLYDLSGNSLAPPSTELTSASYLVGLSPTFSAAPQWNGVETSDWIASDFNGDGKADLLHTTDAGTEVRLSTGSGFADPQQWTAQTSGADGWYAGDFDGNGADDILRYVVGRSGADVFLSTGAGFAAETSWTDAWNGDQRWSIGDFNGDGKDDLLRWTSNVGAEVLVSTGSDFAAATVWTPAGQGSQGWRIGDVNGDGKDDLMRVLPGISGADILLSTGTGFVRAGSWAEHDAVAGWTMGDVDSDGKADLFRTTASGTEVRLSTGIGFAQGSIWLAAQPDTGRWISADFNGDHSHDLLALTNTGSLMFLSDWALDRDRLAPQLFGLERAQAERTVPLGTTELIFEVAFSEPLAELASSAFTVTGTDATVTGIVDEGFGRYLVTVSGGNLGLIKGEVAITLDPAGLYDLSGNPLAPPSTELTSASYLVGLSPTFSAAPQWNGVETSDWIASDFNGDGKADLLHTTDAGTEVRLSTGSGFADPQQWTAQTSGADGWYAGDFDGNGADDILRYVVGRSGADVFLSTGAGFAAETSWTDAWNGDQRWSIGDFNGDGKDDLLRWTSNVGAEVLVSTGSDFAAATVWTPAGQGSQGWRIGDVNGDGKDDLMRVLPGISGADILLSTGTGFVRAGSWAEHDAVAGWTMGDVDSDGKADLFRTTASGTEVRLSTGIGFAQGSIWLAAQPDTGRWISADFNGDHSHDLLALTNTGSLMFLSDWSFF